MKALPYAVLLLSLSACGLDHPYHPGDGAFGDGRTDRPTPTDHLQTDGVEVEGGEEDVVINDVSLDNTDVPPDQPIPVDVVDAVERVDVTPMDAVEPVDAAMEASPPDRFIPDVFVPDTMPDTITMDAVPPDVPTDQPLDQPIDQPVDRPAPVDTQDVQDVQPEAPPATGGNIVLRLNPPPTRYGGGATDLGCWTTSNPGDLSATWNTLFINVNRSDVRTSSATTIRDCRLMQGTAEYASMYQIIDADLRNLKTSALGFSASANIGIIVDGGVTVLGRGGASFCLRCTTTVNDLADAGPIRITFPTAPSATTMGCLANAGMATTLTWMGAQLPGPQLMVGSTLVAAPFTWSSGAGCNTYSGGLTTTPATYVLSP